MLVVLAVLVLVIVLVGPRLVAALPDAALRNVTPPALRISLKSPEID